jgi:hypothetical protein
MNQDDPHAVGQWLQFLQMDMYLQGFIDNGYDDFETIKQVRKLGTGRLSASVEIHQLLKTLLSLSLTSTFPVKNSARRKICGSRAW